MVKLHPVSYQATPAQTYHVMHDVDYLQKRAAELRAAAATARDPSIAQALREVAGDFDNEARREQGLRARPAARAVGG